MIEIKLRDYLKKNLDIDVRLEKPVELPARFIKIERIKTGEQNQIGRCRFAVQSYGESLYETIKLNEKVLCIIRDFVNVKNISRIEIVDSYNFTDITNKRERYQLITDIYYMEE